MEGRERGREGKGKKKKRKKHHVISITEDLGTRQDSPLPWRNCETPFNMPVECCRIGPISFCCKNIIIKKGKERKKENYIL